MNNNYLGCIEAIKQARARKNSLIDSSFELLLSQLSESKVKQHDKNLNEWWNYCISKNTDPLKTEISVILDYFAKKLYVDNVSPDDLKQISLSICLIATDELLEKVHLSSFLCCTFNKELIIDKNVNNKQSNIAGQENLKLSLIDKGKQQYLSKVSMLKENKYSKETTVNNKLPVLMTNNNLINSGNLQITSVNQQMKILVLLSDTEFKVIPFDLTKNQKCNIHDVLGRAGIPVNNKTKILFLTNSKLNYNFIVDCCASADDSDSIEPKNTTVNPSNNSPGRSNTISNPPSEDNNSTVTHNTTLNPSNSLSETTNPFESNNTTLNPSNNSTRTSDTILNPSNNSIETSNPPTKDNNSIVTNNTTLNSSNNLSGTTDPSALANNSFETTNTTSNPSNNSTKTSDTISSPSNNSIKTCNPPTEDNNSTVTNNTTLNPSNSLSETTNPFETNNTTLNPSNNSTRISDTTLNPSNNSIETSNPSTEDNNSAVANDAITNPTNASSTNNSKIYKLPLKIIVNRRKSIIKQQVKILIIIPNFKQKVVTFNLPRKKYYVNDLLLQGGIIINDETEVSLVHHPPLINLNYIVECDSTNLMIDSIEVDGFVNKFSNELSIDSTIFEYPCKKINDLKTTPVEPKIKILIIMPNDQKKLIIFDLPTKKSCVNDLLMKAGIPLNNNTKVSIIEDYPGFNVYYIVKYKANKLVESNESIVKLKDPIVEPTDSNVKSKNSVVELINPIVEPPDSIVESPLEKNTTETSNHTQDNNITINASVSYQSSSNQQHTQLIGQRHNDNLCIDNQIINDANENNLKRKCKEKLNLNQTKKQKSLNSTELIDRYVIIKLDCLAIKTGLFECVPNDPAIVCSNGLSLKLPRRNYHVLVDIHISYSEIHEVEIYSRPKMPVLFVYTSTSAALRIKNLLHIEDENLFVDRAQKRITLLLKSINDELIEKLEKLFSPICQYKVINKKQALVNLQ